ncbi:glycosyl transferase [Streptomyces tricolor]|nr:glycosyl transferase [Streptomyces tricolor]
MPSPCSTPPRCPDPTPTPEPGGNTLLDNVEPFLDDAIQALPQLIEAYADDTPRPRPARHHLLPGPRPRPPLGRPGDLPLPEPRRLGGLRGGDRRADVEGAPADRARTGLLRPVRGWLAENGITQHPDPFVGRPDRPLVLIPGALQPHADRVDERVHTFVGACQGDRADQGDWQRPADAEKVVLVSLGSAFTKQPAFYRACVRAFAGLPGWHVVLQVGRHVTRADLGDVPRRRGGAQLGAAAGHPAAGRPVRHPRGAGGSQEGLATATPMIAVPQAVDQFGNADMLQALGVARHLPAEEADAERLRECRPRPGGRPGGGPPAQGGAGGDGPRGRHPAGGRPHRGRTARRPAVGRRQR